MMVDVKGFGVSIKSHGYLQEMMTPNATRPSTPRTQLSRMTNVQETSFIVPLDIESSIMKVNTMFPTVPENHIRVLFKKWVTHIFIK